MCCGTKVVLPNLAGMPGSVITTSHDRPLTPQDFLYALYAGFGACEMCETARQCVGNIYLNVRTSCVVSIASRSCICGILAGAVSSESQSSHVQASLANKIPYTMR